MCTPWVMRIGAPLLGALLSAWPAAWAAEPLQPPVTLHYIQRPPYMEVSGGELTGITGGPTFAAFKKAGIPVELENTPFARQLRMVEKNAGQDCMIGMFKKPDRELFAKFSKPIYRDQTQVILTAQSKAPDFATLNTIEEIFSDKKLVLLAKTGYSYGASLDALMDKFQPSIRKTADENLLMLKAIKLKMADYMLMAPEEASEAIVAAGFQDSDFKQIKPKNMPPGEYRHIMCSKNVPDETIRKLNAVISYGK